MRTIVAAFCLAIAVVTGMLVRPLPATAGELDLLLDKLMEKGVLTPVEVGMIRRELEDTEKERSKKIVHDGLSEKVRKWEWKGDIRLRNETRLRDDGDDANRQRIRFRYGFKRKIKDNLYAAAQFATGTTSDPISTNQTLNVNFNKVNVLVDRAYLRYEPTIGPVDVAFEGGLIPNPFWTVGPLVWDGDLNFHGVAAHGEMDLTDNVKFFTHNGVFLLDTDQTESVPLYSVSGGLEIKPFTETPEVLKELTYTGAVAYHDYQNLDTSDYTFPTNVTTNTAALRAFDIINTSHELKTKIKKYPVKGFFDYVHNVSSAVMTNDKGWQAGIKLGKAKKPINWKFTSIGSLLKESMELSYFYQRLEQDAAFDEFVDSDFNRGGTNNKGMAYGVTFQVLEDSTLGVKVLDSEILSGSSAGTDRTTIQTDWVSQF